MLPINETIILVVGFSISIQICLSLFFPYLIFVQLPIYSNSIFLVMSVFTHDIENIETLYYVIAMEFTSLSVVLLFHFSGILVYVRDLLKDLRSNFDFFTKSYVVGIIIILVSLAFFLGADLFSTARSFYVEMRVTSKAGGISQFFYEFFFIFASLFSFHLSMALLMVGFLLFSGSKGVAIQPLFNYAAFTFVASGLSWKIILILPIGFGLTYLIIYFLIQGTDSAFMFFIKHYFDYAANLDKVTGYNVFLPNEFWNGSFNEVIPGLNRIFNIKRIEYAKFFFPDDVRFGKNPGLLGFENMSRLGIPLFYVFSLFQVFLTVVLYKLVKKTVRSDIVKFVLFMFLVFIQSFRFFWLALLVVYGLQFLRGIVLKFSRTQ